MSRSFKIKGVPDSVICVVIAILRDYRRRKILHTLPENYAFKSLIDKAAEDIEIGCRDDIIKDICIGRGYWKSPCNFLISHDTYYKRKRYFIKKIAESLHLI